ncbi:right-handed parallel beta-helix repeat-containing protein [Candidatus Micrarchaeota archaeon]|nr:right-handed parallel beta-helix repeat-containing protein [Candidatus Micrarchaeota archaeon]
MIDSCQTLNATNETYELDGNINASDGNASDGVCFTIDAPNVVLDCKNFQINGPGLASDATAVLILNNHDTTHGDNAFVRNCQINGFANGVAVQGANNANISNNAILNPFGDSRPDFPFSNTGGITLDNSDNSLIADNTIDSNSEWSIKLQNSNSNNVLRNHVTHAAIHGIYVVYASNNVVRGNTVWETGWNGQTPVTQSMEIELLYSDGNTIESNNVTDYHAPFCAANSVPNVGCEMTMRGCTTACGIMLLCGSNNQFLTNTVDHFETGIGMVQSHGLGSGCDGSGYPQNYNVIRGNTVTNTYSSAIKVFNANNTIVDANIIPNAYRTGISYTGNAYFGTISGNTVRYAGSLADNMFSGLVLAGAFQNTVAGNTLTNNYMHGLIFSQDNDDNTFSGNTISRNGGIGILLGAGACPFGAFPWIGDCVVERNTFTNDNISYNGFANIVGSLTDSAFYNDPVWGWVRVSGGQDNRFIDGIVQNAGSVPDVYSSGSSSLYFINTLVTRSLETFANHNESNVTVSWYMDVHVQDLNGLAVSSAQVTITNAFGTVVFTGATDASGNIPRQTLPEYFAKGANLNSVYTDYAPYTVAVTNGCAHASASTPFTSSTALTLTLDVNAPVISNVHVIDVTANTVTLGWETSELTNETLEYGLNTAYGSLFTNAAFATGHSVFLNGLSSATPYHYRVNACDVQCNCASASDFTFTTITATGGGGGGGGGGGNPTVVPTVAPTAVPTTVPTAGPTTAPTTTPGGVTPTPTIAPTVAGTLVPTPTLAPGTGLVTAAGPDYGLWGGILLLLILLALLIYWYMRRKKKKD